MRVFISLLLILSGVLAVLLFPASPPACSAPAVSLTSDYAYLIGSASFSDPDGDPESGSLYRWLVNATPLGAAQRVAEDLLLNFDGVFVGANGEQPSQAQSVNYAPGKWGQALALGDGGQLAYDRPDNLSLAEGSLEMWVALRAAGTDPIYASQWQVLLAYQAPNGDSLYIAQDADTGILYGGGEVNGQWQSAYGALGDMRDWQAGQWHHLALVYSAAGNFMRFYVDGVLAADTNEGHYWPPASTGSQFFIGGTPWNETAHYWIDAARLSGRASGAGEIAARAHRLDPPRPNEAWLPTSLLSPGDAVAFEFTPIAAGQPGLPCASAARLYPGIPVTDPQPASTLLAPGATSFDLTVHTIANTACAYSVGAILPYESMTPFDQGAGSQVHQTRVVGLNPDAKQVNHVYVRCAAHPDYLLHQFYRVRSQVNPGYPRTGNLWGWWNFLEKDVAEMARIDLWLGADFPPGMVRQLRQLNPDILILTSINAVENSGLPDDYYLKDIHGNRIEVWPDSFRLNLTKTYVAEYQARYAYQFMLDGGMMYDGVFFDNVMTTQSWLTEDIYGNPVDIDANEDGQPDDPDVLDAAWNAGVFHEIETFRQLMPHAVVSSHSTDIYEPGIAGLFNGNSLGFRTANVLEGEEEFQPVWNTYHDWLSRALPPTATMVEASPIDQFAYGYDYSPWEKIPPATLEFARTYYPHMRFSLAFALMDDGYFAYEFGDTWHGNDWWYDELDFDLGYPLGPAERLPVQGFDPGLNLILNGDFEAPLADPWNFWVNTDAGCQAQVSRDTSTAAQGSASARIDINAISSESWHIEFAQYQRSLQQGVEYDFSFWAKADAPHLVYLSAQKDAPDWDSYGLDQSLLVDTTWQPYTVSFRSNATVSDARIQFFLGERTGTVWLDDVRLALHPPDVYRREFTHGLALLNGSRDAQVIDLDPGWRRLAGAQSPRFETVLDDASPYFATCPGCTTAAYDSGEWQAAGPFYHDWGSGVHQVPGASHSVTWSLPIAATDVYTVSVWWPAAPQSVSWNSNAVYQLVAGGQVIASASFDQRTGGDQWHTLAAAALSTASAPVVRLLCPGSAPCIADAVYLRSRARYNDGSPVSQITLAPLDGMILRRETYWLYFPFILLP